MSPNMHILVCMFDQRTVSEMLRCVRVPKPGPCLNKSTQMDFWHALCSFKEIQTIPFSGYVVSKSICALPDCFVGVEGRHVKKANSNIYDLLG